MRRAAKTDDSAGPIVEAIEAEGWEVYHVRLPCDVICWHPVLDILVWMELKTRAKSGRIPMDKRQETQRKFLAWTSCPIVTTPEEALEVLRKHYPSDVPPPDLIAYAHRLRGEFESQWKRNGTASLEGAGLALSLLDRAGGQGVSA